MATIDQILGPIRERVRASCEAVGLDPGQVLRDGWEIHGDHEVTVTLLCDDGRRERRTVPLVTLDE